MTKNQKKTIKEEIKKLKKQLIKNDWVNGAGNTFSQELWEELCREDSVMDLKYTLDALIEFLEKNYKL